jgi:YfiH family protein
MTGGFDRRSSNGVVFYVARALEEIPGVRHGFSTRHGGSSRQCEGALNLAHVPWDAPGNVAENRARFLRALDLEASELVTLAQVHSDRVVVVEQGRRPGNRLPRSEGDSLITGAPAVSLGIQVADCFPVIAAIEDGRLVANAHAGWRGTLGLVAAKTVATMRSLAPAHGRIVAALGPGIRACCFEVGSDVAERFETAFPGVRVALGSAGAPDKFRVDLPAALRAQLSASGVAVADIHDLGLCTRCAEDDFFSYRREGAQSGRLMAVVARAPDGLRGADC